MSGQVLELQDIYEGLKRYGLVETMHRQVGYTFPLTECSFERETRQNFDKDHLRYLFTSGWWKKAEKYFLSFHPKGSNKATNYFLNEL
jgi:hypothetical protein